MQNKDNFHLWLISGICGTIAKDVYSLIAEVSKFSHYLIWNIAADIFLDSKAAINSGWGYILGACADLLIGSLLGIAICIILNRSFRNGLLKAVLVTLTAWLTFFGAFMHVFPQVFISRPTDPASYVSSFIAHCLHAVVVYTVYLKLSKAKIN